RSLLTFWPRHANQRPPALLSGRKRRARRRQKISGENGAGGPGFSSEAASQAKSNRKTNSFTADFTDTHGFHGLISFVFPKNSSVRSVLIRAIRGRAVAFAFAFVL